MFSNYNLVLNSETLVSNNLKMISKEEFLTVSNFVKLTSKVKLGYDEQLGTGHFCSL
jgi:hypothetical protein